MIPALLLILAAAAMAFVLRRLLASRSEEEVASFWARVAAQLIVILSPACLLSAALETLWPRAYHAGHHLQLDLTGAFGWSLGTCFLLALALPFLCWLVLLGLAWWRRPAPEASRHFLAAGVGLAASRRWLLLWSLPLVLVLIVLLPRLGGGPGAYPASAWSFGVLLSISLLGVMSASGANQESPSVPIAVALDEAVMDWPEALTQGGVPTRPLARWQGVRRSLQGSGEVRRLAESLHHMGASGVAPELLRAVAELLTPGPGRSADRARVVLGPEGCGQAELVVLAARLLGRRQGTHTLVVSAAGTGRLAAALTPWLRQGEGRVIEGHGELPPAERLWMVDGDTLGELLLPRLQESGMAQGVGLVVWWDLEAASGAQAAGLWALSRRLDRLLTAYGPPDLRTLAFLCRVAHPDAQQSSYLQGLLPFDLGGDTLVQVPGEGPWPVRLWQLPAALSTAHARQLASSAVGASLGAGWSTHLDLGPQPVTEARFLLEQLRQAVPEGKLSSAAKANARIHLLRPEEVLALRDILGQGGRALGPEALGCGFGAHQVGLLVPAHQPYLRYLLARPETADGPPLGTARRLLAASSGGPFLRHQLEQALAELPDTRQGLLATFFHEGELVQGTLQAIAAEGNLERREVRSLDVRQRLVVDHRYRIRRPADVGITAAPGGDQVTVRDPAADLVCLRVDRQRLGILAYPQRVFVAHGRRYRVADWSSPEAVWARGLVECVPEDVAGQTWRCRHGSVWDLQLRGRPVTMGRGERSLRRVLAELSFEEELTGVVRIDAQAAGGQGAPLNQPKVSLFDVPIRTSFRTFGLLLDLGGGDGSGGPGGEERGPASLCEALRHVLPVHLGVAADDVEILPLWGEESAESFFGIALVETWPGGMGLAQALEGSDDFLTRLLGWTRDWLRQSLRAGNVLDTPAARATAMDYLPDPESALALLERAL